MFKALLERLGAAGRVAIPDDLWRATVETLPFIARLDVVDRERLRRLAEALLADKEMAAAGELELNAQIQVNIAAQACLPILNLGIDWYRGWNSIVVYPGEFLVPREVVDDDGVVHEYVEPIAGEAWDGGPLLVSWEDAQIAGQPDRGGYNVVIHEFTHKIDLLNGDADGVPPFSHQLHPSLDVRAWQQALQDAYERFNVELDLIEATLPAHLAPDDEAADAYYAHLPLDAYAAHNLGEFFAVSSEAFFVDPTRLAQAFPPWYRQLALFFRQDPLGLGIGPDSGLAPAGGARGGAP
ncbi:MAG: zinc-dependent peptidase [Betaproteobacteria bacterium]